MTENKKFCPKTCLKEFFCNYHPLVSLVLVSILAAVALNYSSLNIIKIYAKQLPNAFTLSFMHYFMGVFLMIFSLLKIFNLKKFAENFSKYDLLASKVKIYGFIYPFIELIFGLAFLAFVYLYIVYAAVALVFAFGAIGVILGLKKGLDINCPCMGSVLKVPMSKVTLFEDIIMIIMVASMYFMLP